MAEYKFNLNPRDVPTLETKYRSICTKIPVPESLETIARSAKYEPGSVCDQLPAVWDRAVDFQVFDAYGNCWIDFSSGILVANAGHGNPEIVRELEAVLKKPLLHNYSYFSEVRSRLAEKLVEISPENITKAFLLTTGSEAVESSIKVARLYSMKKNPCKVHIIAFEDSFHGKTMCSQTLTGDKAGMKWIPAPDQYIHQFLFPTDYRYSMDVEKSDYGSDIFERDIKNLTAKGVNPEDIAAVIFNPYHGWGCLFFPKGYIQAMRDFADEHGILLISDEVQAGFARTGKLFGFQHYDVDVDIIACGKAVSGGLPLSAVLSRDEILEGEPSLHSTHGGNPVCCTSALANLNYLIEKNLISEAARKGRLIQEGLEKLQREFPGRILSIHGKGMAYAAIVAKPQSDEPDAYFVDRVIERAFEKGLISVRTQRGSLKVSPPLTISDAALLEGLEVLAEAFRECVNEEV